MIVGRHASAIHTPTTTAATAESQRMASISSRTTVNSTLPCGLLHFAHQN